MPSARSGSTDMKSLVDTFSAGVEHLAPVLVDDRVVSRFKGEVGGAHLGDSAEAINKSLWMCRKVSRRLAPLYKPGSSVWRNCKA
jgi:hypothetical protein